MTDLKKYGYDTTQEEYPDGLIPARITAVHRGRYELVCDKGTAFGQLKAGAYYDTGEDVPTVGDFVLIHHNPYGDSLVLKNLPRKSCFYRKEPGPVPRKQMVAANFDYVFIMSSLNRDFNINRISRYLTMSWQSGGIPVIILTKADLCDNAGEYIQAVEQIAAGAPVVAVSSVTKQGLDRLEEYLAPEKTVVFLGMSGIGKSSLLNALAGEDLMAVKEIREDDARGRHTTTHRQLVMLPCGAMVIDTPGMRELGLWNADEGISTAFLNVEDLFHSCRFTDCGHTSEPGCAVLAALEDGSLTHRQWEQYQAQKREAAYAEDKSGYVRERSNKFKSISKQLRQQYKDKGKY